MKKIMILGTPGSGKTFLSNRLSSALGIETYHLDKLMWDPDWKAKSIHEMAQIQDKILQNENWIIDGYYHQIADKRFDQADTIILLDSCLLFNPTFMSILSCCDGKPMVS